MKPQNELLVLVIISHDESLKNIRDGSRISGKRVHIYQGVGVRFADFIPVFLKYPM